MIRFLYTIAGDKRCQHQIKNARQSLCLADSLPLIMRRHRRAAIHQFTIPSQSIDTRLPTPAALGTRRNALVPAMNVGRHMLLALLMAACVCAAAAQSDKQRLANLESVRSSKRSNMLKLNIDSFRKYIEAAPRSYSLIVMFSADPSMCRPCEMMRRQLESVAAEYYALPENRRGSTPVYFAELKVALTDQAFLGEYSVTHVPILYHFAAGKAKSYPSKLKHKSINSYDIQGKGIGINQVKQFVNERVGSKLKVVIGGYTIPFVDTVRAVMPIIVLACAAFGAFVAYKGLYKQPMLWFALVMAVYIFSVGGGHFSWIHKVPLAAVNVNGQMEFIASGSRSQYVAEGFFVSVTCVCISALILLIQELPTAIPNKSGQTVAGLILAFMTYVAIAALLVMYYFVSASCGLVALFNIAMHSLLAQVFFVSDVSFPVFYHACITPGTHNTSVHREQKMPSYLSYSEM